MREVSSSRRPSLRGWRLRAREDRAEIQSVYFRTDVTKILTRFARPLAHALARTTMGRPRDVSVPGRALLLKTLHACDIDHKYMIYDEVDYNIGYYLY